MLVKISCNFKFNYRIKGIRCIKFYQKINIHDDKHYKLQRNVASNVTNTWPWMQLKGLQAASHGFVNAIFQQIAKAQTRRQDNFVNKRVVKALPIQIRFKFGHLIKFSKCISKLAPRVPTTFISNIWQTHIITLTIKRTIKFSYFL